MSNHGVATVQTVLPVEGVQSTVSGPLEAFLMNALDSPHSRRAYRRHVLEAFRIMGTNTVAAVTPDGLVRYREILLTDGRGDVTHTQVVSALRGFLNNTDPLGIVPRGSLLLRFA